MTTLGDFTSRIVDQAGPPEKGEFTYVDIGSVDNKAKRILTPKSIPVESAPSRARQRLRSGDVLVSMTRPNLNAVAFVPQELDGAIGSTGFHVLRALDGVEPRLLFYAVQTRDFIETMATLVQGALYPAVRPRDIRAYPLALPPIGEQRRIVAEIEKQFSRLDEAVTSLKRVQANLKRYKASVLKAAVEGKLTEEWRKQHRDVEPADRLLKRILSERTSRLEERHLARRARSSGVAGADSGRASVREPATINASSLPSLPPTWRWTSVEALGDVQLGQQLHPKYYHGSNVRPYLRVQNVLEDRLDLSDVKSMHFEESELYKFELRPGDILLNEGQSPEWLGRPALYSGEIPGACFQKTLIRFRAYSPLRPEYALLVFRHYMHSGRFLGEGAITTNIAHLTAVRFAPIEFPLPPLEEQGAIVVAAEERFSAMGFVERTLGAALRRADRLRQSILHKAFSGQLVPQDPNDDPASVLLDRIRAQRGEAPRRAGLAPPGAKPSRSAGQAPPNESRLQSPEKRRVLAQREPERARNGNPASAILSLLQHGREYSRAEVVDALGLTVGQWNEAIRELKASGVVVQTGERRGAKYKRQGPSEGPRLHKGE